MWRNTCCKSATIHYLLTARTDAFLADSRPDGTRPRGSPTNGVLERDNGVMAQRALTSTNEPPCSFVSGYFTDQFAAGERPDYGYPKNHLPETTLDNMEVVTGFMASQKKSPKK